MQNQLPPKASLRRGRFIVESLYKKGGQALVYRGLDAESGQPVIIKQTDGEEPWLRHEAELLSQLSHPSLPRVIDVFEEQGNTCLVMSFVPGRDFSELMRNRGGAFSVAEVMGWTEQLLDILDYLQKHEDLIVHRDINPKNIRLAPDNRIFLLDFGISKRAYSKTLLVGGTPHYAPPEQLKDEGTDHRSDIYSLAATLYYLLTAVEPPDALSREAAILKGLSDPLVPAHELNHQVPRHLARALSQAMSLDRERRPLNSLTLRSRLLDQEGPEAGQEEDDRTVVAERYEVDETTPVRGRAGGLDKRPNPIVVPLGGAHGRDATPEALTLLDNLNHARAVPSELVQILIELMDSRPDSRSGLLKNYSTVIEKHKGAESRAALNLIKLLRDNCLLEPTVKAELRQRLGRVMAGEMLAGLSPGFDGSLEHKFDAAEVLLEPENPDQRKAHRGRLRSMLVWIARGAILATLVHVGLLLFAGRRTLVDALLLGSARSVIWAMLFLFAYTGLLFILVRRLSRIRAAEKNYDLLLAVIGLGYGLTLAGVFLHALSALIS